MPAGFLQRAKCCLAIKRFVLRYSFQIYFGIAVQHDVCISSRIIVDQIVNLWPLIHIVGNLVFHCGAIDRYHCACLLYTSSASLFREARFREMISAHGQLVCGFHLSWFSALKYRAVLQQISYIAAFGVKRFVHTYTGDDGKINLPSPPVRTYAPKHHKTHLY